MDSPDLPAGKPSPRRELQLQGPRPTPLKIRKDSHKIKKPPIAPQLPHHQHQQQQSFQQPAQQNRPPVIIYTVSPKVIHTDANDFMKLVQRLTGPSSSSLSSPSVASLIQPAPSSSSSSSIDYSGSTSGLISPAARFASIEKTNSSSQAVKLARRDESISSMEGLEMGPTVERTGSFPGILSPVPSSLPPISPNFFSPTIDPNNNSFSFLHDLSPMFNGSNLMPSPSTFLQSPTPPFDLFNQFLDL